MRNLSPDARGLIDAVGGNDGPSGARRAHVKRRLAAQLAASGVVLSASQLAAATSGHVGAAAAASAIGKASVSVGTVALWLAGGALAGTLVSASVALIRVGEAPGTESELLRAPPVPRAVSPRSSPIPSVTVARQAEAEAVVAAKPPVDREVSPSRAGARRVASLLPPDAANGTSSLQAFPNVGAETELLASAQRELAAGQGERALELLQRHETEFPNATLSEERSFARVIALCQLGRRAEARARAEAFLLASPRSPLLPRLRKSCALAADSTREGEAR